jgi:Mn2+/Fe2+ NRAMP family transporter
LSAADVVVTNLITLVTEVVAIRVGMGFFGVPAAVAVCSAIVLIVLSACGSRYSRWERVTMGLALFNLVFVAAAVLVHPSVPEIGHALLTWSPLPGGTIQAFLLILASNIGATVTPWMLFFQQSASVDKGLTPLDIPLGRIDTLAGTVLATVAGCAAVIAAAPLFTHHVDMRTFGAGTGFAQALRAFVGYPVASVFALGLMEAGATAMLTISASTAYAIGEVAGGAGHSFNRSLAEAPLFHAANIGLAIVAGIIVLIPGAPLLAITLNANLLAAVLMPPALVFLLILANDPEIMGKYVNTWFANLLGVSITLLVALAASASAIVSFIATVAHGH